MKPHADSSTAANPLSRPRPAWPAAWQDLLDTLLQASCVVDAESLRVLAVNTSATQLWGRSAAELTAISVEELAATPEDQLFWTQLHSWPQATVLHSDSLILHADGSTREVERRLCPFQLPDGRPAWMLSLTDLSGQRRAEREVERLTAELGATFGASNDAILITDLEGRVRHWNAAFARLWNLPEHCSARHDQGEVGLILHGSMADAGAYEDSLAHRMDELRDAHGSASLRAARGGLHEPQSAPAVATDRFLLGDGRTVERRLLPQYGRGLLVGWVQVWRDLTAQVADQARLQLAAQVFDATLDALLVTDADGNIVAANPAAALLTGRSTEALQDGCLQPLLEGVGNDGGLVALTAGLPRWQGELTVRSPQGAVPVQATLLRISGSGRPANGCIVVLRDQSERDAAQRQIEALAHTDTLTGLPNRMRMVERLQEQADRSAAQGSGFALLVFGLDRFKHLNQCLGHPSGDRLLQEVGRRLSGGLRDGDTVARLGGDTFGVLLPQADAAVAETVARRLLSALSDDLTIEGVAVTLSASVGVALFPQDARRSDELLHCADSAMHRVKERHGGDVRFYQPQMNVDRLEHIRLDHAMRRGLAQGHFRVHYQPQVNLASGEIVGAEALCRWTDPELGEISPARFIAVAEETGFISELGDWVLHQSAQQARRWMDLGRPVPVSVNVSILQFQQPLFVERVGQVLAEQGLPAELLELELTESILVGDVEEILAQLRALAALGVQLAIDDFGTGYSSLGYLRRLPIHRLKIDRSFIHRLPDDESDAAITRTVVELARALHLRVIAEGVENTAQRDHLAALGCHEYQGWLCAPALPAEEFDRLHLLHAHTKRATLAA